MQSSRALSLGGPLSVSNIRLLLLAVRKARCCSSSHDTVLRIAMTQDLVSGPQAFPFCYVLGAINDSHQIGLLLVAKAPFRCLCVVFGLGAHIR